MHRTFDFVLVGGGLQNALLALALLDRRPGITVAMVEASQTLGGNHTWSFHADDVPADARHWVDPLVEYRWPSYAVHFPTFERQLLHPYASLTSAHLHDVVARAMRSVNGTALFLRQSAVRVLADEVTLDDGTTLRGGIVIDARGPSLPDESGTGPMGFQKFVGLEVELSVPGGLTAPVLMDARVPQSDGFRFVYTLPFTSTRWLIEDTYFSSNAHLDRAALRRNVLMYAAERGYRIDRIVREEVGILPLPWAQTIVRSPRAARGGPFLAGYGGGWFHPATGYSFPIAVRFARCVAHADSPRSLTTAIVELTAEHRRQARFCHLLNRLLFVAVAPEQRHRVFARFYSLPDETIRRFYALRLTARDRLRILVGRPPRGISLRGMWAAMEA